jgi:hypothetical protein
MPPKPSRLVQYRHALALQILQLGEVNGGEPLITALVSYRNPAVAARCGLPTVIDASP